MTAFTAMAAVFPLFLFDRFGITEATIGYFFVYIGAVNVVMRALILGWLVDRLGEARVMRLGATILGLSLALLPFAPGIPAFVVLSSGLPIGTALLFPSTSAMITHRAEEEEMGQTLGVQQAYGGIARVVGPIGGAAAFQALGPAIPFYGAATIVAATLFFVLAFAHREPSAGEAPA